MPGTKRTTKAVSYTEHNDDDDFISTVDNTKETRRTKSNDQQIESKSSTRSAPRKRNEKLSKVEQDELDLALKLSKETTQTNETTIEISIISDDKENTTSQSIVSNNESKTKIEKEIDEQDENSLPKSKRMKREEEEEDTDEGKLSDEDEEEINDDDDDEEEEEEEEEETVPQKKSIRKSKETKKNSDLPSVTSIDVNSSRLTTRGQQKSLNSTTDLSKKKSNAPLGFPTSKIIIPSLQSSRVGLSRKSSAIKPLHPNLNQRIVHQ